MVDSKSKVTILRSESLRKEFGGIHAVQDLNFDVFEGEIRALIGPNGSGKTTFFNLIMNLYPATSGSIYFGENEVDLTRLSTHRISTMGIARTFQTLRLFPNLTILENMLVGMHGRLRSGYFDAILKLPRFRREERDSIEKALEILSIFGSRLLSMANEPAMSLSYANRRRLEIARALASKPKLLLLDEPVAGMNPTETAEVTKQIEQINLMGYTILLIEHDMTLVEGVAHRVVAMDHGTKIAEGSYKEVCSDPEVIKAYLGSGAHP